MSGSARNGPGARRWTIGKSQEGGRLSPPDPQYDRYTGDTRRPWPRGLTGVPGSCRGRRLAPPDPGVLRGDMRTSTDRHAKTRNKHSSQPAGSERIRSRSWITERVSKTAADASAIRAASLAESGAGHDTGGDGRVRRTADMSGHLTKQWCRRHCPVERRGTGAARDREASSS